ncbi:hypothetical protein ABZ918_05645 [Streptomyces viridosporus]|uniref:hypothetical protein n=1 Tax=Streptomyces viridosporus TaxID=67581 RepID=UPI003429735D
MTTSKAREFPGHSKIRKAKKMRLNRKRILFASVSVLALSLTVVLLHSFSLPPFKKKGVIHAEEICDSLGSAPDATSSLEGVLPDRATYSFNDSTPDPRTDETDISYLASCFVTGDGEQLLSVMTEMLEYDQADDWVQEAVGQFAPRASLEPFSAGDKAVASSRVSAVYVPCSSHGENRHLSVVVRLKKNREADPSELRKNLIALTKSAASHAHQAAHCEVPSKVSS